MNIDNKVKPLHIIFPRISAYVKSFDWQSKWMHFLIEDDGLLEKNNTDWDNAITDFCDKTIFS